MATIGQVVYNLQDFHSSGGLVSTDETNPAVTISSAVEKNEATHEYEANPLYAKNKINIFGKENNEPDALDEDIVAKFNKGGAFTKLGIQAPPGTQVNLNSNQRIMIGRTGVYELDEDIKITKMWFERPKKYVIDNAATSQSLTEGIEGFKQAENYRNFSLEKLNVFYMRKIEDYMLEYNAIKNTTYPDSNMNTIVSELRQLDITNPNPTPDKNYDAYWEKYFELRAQIPDLILLDNSYENSISKDDIYWAYYTSAQDTYEVEYSKAQAKYIAGVNGIYILPNPDNPNADENYEELYNVIIDFLY